MKLSMREAEVVIQVVSTTGEFDDEKKPIKRAFSLEDLQEYRKFAKSYEEVFKKHNELLDKKREKLKEKYGDSKGKMSKENENKANLEFQRDKELIDSYATLCDYEVSEKFTELVKDAFNNFSFCSGDLGILDVMEKF